MGGPGGATLSGSKNPKQRHQTEPEKGCCGSIGAGQVCAKHPCQAGWFSTCLCLVCLVCTANSSGLGFKLKTWAEGPKVEWRNRCSTRLASNTALSALHLTPHTVSTRSLAAQHPSLTAPMHLPLQHDVQREAALQHLCIGVAQVFFGCWCIAQPTTVEL